MGDCQRWARLVSKVLFVMARASDLWLRLLHPHLPTGLDTSKESEADEADLSGKESTDSSSELSGVSPTPTSQEIPTQQSPCEHYITTTAGTNGFVNRKRCRICGEILVSTPKK